MIKRNIDIAVIGAGAAGLPAAIKAKEAGIKDVMTLDRNEDPGEILPQCIHRGFGLHYFKQNLTDPEYISRFIKKRNTYRLNGGHAYPKGKNAGLRVRAG